MGKNIIKLFVLASAIFSAYPFDGLKAQEDKQNSIKKAWEVGIGANGLHISRFGITDLYVKPSGDYSIKTSKQDLMFGINLYAARQLNKFFYLDFQGVGNYAKDPVKHGKEGRYTLMGGLGFQYRWGAHFDSKYIDPYFRVGANYMYKNFDLYYDGTESVDKAKVGWHMLNNYNKEGKDRTHSTPISIGAGVNMWVTNNFGLGIQADYLVMPYKNVANIWQGLVRLNWRIGGESKKQKPVIEYITEYIEKPVVVEKIVVQKEPAQVITLYDLFSTIYFDFDKFDITPQSAVIIEKIAEVMKRDTSKRYLITGCTDARGSEAYNIRLSENRAKSIVDELVKLGVPSQMLKYRGVGKKMAYVHKADTDSVRRGDRRTIIENVENMDYWEKLK